MGQGAGLAAGAAVKASGRDWKMKPFEWAECLTCDWECQANTQARRKGREHARGRDHTVRVETERTAYFNDYPAGRGHR
jgi:hypothetical protein